MLVPKGRRERERGLNESVVLTNSESESYACVAPTLLAIDGVQVLARHGRHAEGWVVGVDGSTMSSNCAATLVVQEAECAALAAADVDVVAECETLAPWTPMSVVDTSQIGRAHV